MDKYNLTTSILSISSKNNRIKNCEEITKLMKKLGVASSISTNRSIICNPKNPCACYVEYGCDIRLNGLQPHLIKSKVWGPLQEEFQFTCAHLNIPGQFHGCIHDFQNSSFHKNN